MLPAMPRPPLADVKGRACLRRAASLERPRARRQTPTPAGGPAPAVFGEFPNWVGMLSVTAVWAVALPSGMGQWRVWPRRAGPGWVRFQKGHCEAGPGQRVGSQQPGFMTSGEKSRVRLGDNTHISKF